MKINQDTLVQQQGVDVSALEASVFTSANHSPAVGRKIHVMQIVGDPVGGIRKHVHTILSHLSPSEFTLSYTHSRSVDSRFNSDIEKLRPMLVGEIEIDVKKRPHFSDVQNLWRLYKYIRNHQVEIVHGHGAKGGLYARVLGKLCNVRSVYTPHGGSVHAMFSASEEWVYTTAERLLFGITDFFVFESNYTQEAFHAKVGKTSPRWIRNYNGISPLKNLPFRESRLENGIYKIGVFGILRQPKGQIFAIEAVEKILQGGDKVELHFFGEGPDGEDLSALCCSKGIDHVVHFHGDVSEVSGYMTEMDLVVIPSLFEAFGYVAIEAMALAKPVIASDVGGLRELIIDGKTGLLIEPANPEQLSAAILKLMKHRDLAKSLAENGRVAVLERFSVSEMIKTLQDIYMKLCVTE